MAISPAPLVHRRVDGWLLGGVGIVAWLLLTPLAGHAPVVASLGVVATWVLIGLGAAHFGVTYHLAYRDGAAALRRHPLALLWVPVALAVATGGVLVLFSTGAIGDAEWLLRALLVAVFTLTGWHYIKQAYGVAVLTLRMRGARPTRGEVTLLRYGFYPVWFVDLLDVWGAGHRASAYGYDVHMGLLPVGVRSVAQTIAVGLCVCVLGAVVRVSRRAGIRPPLGAWAPYVVGVLWFVSAPTTLAAPLVLAGLHALQYLTVVHRTELAHAEQLGERPVVFWWCVFGGATAGGLLLARWLPDLLERSSPSEALPALATVLLFVMLNLHHYAMDAAVWRSQGAHLRRLLPQTAADDSAHDERQAELTA